MNLNARQAKNVLKKVTDVMGIRIVTTNQMKKIARLNLLQLKSELGTMLFFKIVKISCSHNMGAPSLPWALKHASGLHYFSVFL